MLPATSSAMRATKLALNVMPCFWANSTSTPVALASPGGGFIYSFVVFYSHGINNAGNMVGYAYTPGFAAVRAVSWASSSSPAVVLSTVSEFTNTVAAGISDNGQIVGYGFNEDFSKSRPFLSGAIPPARVSI
jgi:hypothetical protein